MAFDQSTRNQLARLVTQCRSLLTEEFSKQCQSLYGIRPDGHVTPLDELRHLSDQELATARQLRERIDYLVANDATATFEIAVDRLLREQAFTVMNRLAAMRMAEARELIIESVARGMESEGFTMYDMIGGASMGERFERYRCYLYSMFDELAVDLGALFARYSPYGLLFPRETAFKGLLEQLNEKTMEGIWAEDETIGWIYQYWNSKEERKAMRDASAAPRNSRELAVRNQFFTPRYVVEFLTDNTLGRIWFEMTKGQTGLTEQCRYLVRRPTEIFLGEGEDAPPSKEGPEGDTEETLSQEELLKQPVHIPHRPVKDPREIRLLDPACGSMHFGLYAFDLFEAIYEEAWEIANSGSIPEGADPSFTDYCSLITDHYDSKESYLRDVPRLIIEHNIHGVDIDPRAVQIAGLSLWLRAQKTWKDTPAAERPCVRRSNIVCAEPMPGSDAMLEDFVQTLDPPLLGELVKTVFDKMQLAGEAGTLLKIEEEIRTAIDDAKAKWEKLGAAERDLFSAEELNQTPRPGAQQELTGVEKALTTDQRPLATNFFDTAEERIYAALRDYAESAEAGDYQRRLFAEDAAHGFAFIDLCRKRYDAAVMNPPFGLAEQSSKAYVFKNYPDEKCDLYACFVTAAINRATRHALIGCLTNRTFFALESLARWRNSRMLSNNKLICALDLGFGVLDGAKVEAAAYVIEALSSRALLTVGDLLSEESKSDSAERLFENPNFDAPPFYSHQHQAFLELPSHPIAYNVPASLISKITASSKVGDTFGARAGLQTNDDFRFLRLCWEVPTQRIGGTEQWIWLSKGGDYLPLVSDLHVVANWDFDGREMKTLAENLYAQWSRTIPSIEFQLRPGVTYSERTTSGVSLRVMPEGCLFTKTGPGLFADSSAKHLLLIGLSYSRFLKLACEMFVGGGDDSASGSLARHYRTAIIAKLPLPDLATHLQGSQLLDNLTSSALRAAANKSIEEDFALFQPPTDLSRCANLKGAFQERERTFLANLVVISETKELIEDFVNSSYAFTGPELGALDELQGQLPTSYRDELPEEDADSCARHWRASQNELTEFAKGRCGASMQIVKKDFFINRKVELLAHAFRVRPKGIISSLIDHSQGWEPDDAFGSELVSILTGYPFGRWDIRYATGERQPPELPDPFDPLPVCPPGMLQNADGLPAAPSDVPDDYPLPITWPGILVSDPGHPEDIVARVRDALAVIWGDRSAAIEQEACEILGVRTLRDYFAEKKSGGKFFKDHLKRYSKSRRQAPIYWPLSTESGTYTLWIYYHRLTEDTLYACITNFVAPKQEQAEKTLTRLAAKGDARTKAEDKEYEQTETLIGELATFRAELERLAKIWKPNLNDGVQITAAPLWSLFRLKPWQKKLKDTWQKLESGDYDWAHLAHTLWPDRVIPKCAEDRSLAIAHGYETDLWEEVTDDKGKSKWQPKKDAEEIVESLIAKRSS